VDGNKRTAYAAAEMFSLLNGKRLAASDEASFELTLGVASGATSKDQVTAFFRHHVKPDQP
jgi:death-on-curing protein